MSCFRRISPRRLLAGGLACLVPWAASAQPQDLTAFTLEELLSLEVASVSKFVQKITDAPASITVLTAQEFRDYGWRTLGEALRSVRGLYIASDRQYDFLGVRGFGRPQDYNSRMLILVDGHRVNDNVYDQGFLGSELNLDVDLIDRVEIVRGPSSSVYGSNAFFGVINIITRPATRESTAEIAVAGGSHDAANARATLSGTTARGLGYVLSGRHRSTTGETVTLPAGIRAPRGADELRDDEVFGKLTAGGWSLQAMAGDRRKGAPGGAFASEVDDRRNAIRDRLAIIGTTYDRRIGAVDVSGRATWGHYDYRATWVYGEPLYAVPSVTHEAGAGTWWNGEIKAVASVGARHRFVVGLEHQWNPQQLQTGDDPLGSYVADRRSSTRTGAYLQDDISLAAALIVSAGVRYDRFSGGDDAVSPRLGIIWHAARETTLKLLYGTAFRKPNAYEQYYVFPGVATSNPALRPETIDTWELTAERRYGDRARVAASAYHYVIDRLIDAGIDDSAGLTQYQNLESARATGVELEGELVVGSARLRGSIAHQDAQDGNGAHLTNSPRLLAAVNASVPLPWPRWRLGIEAQHVGARDTGLSHIPAYTVANLALTAADLLPGVSASLGVRNLFDERWSEPAEFDGTRDLMPQPCRSLSLELTYRR